jgi:vacuolar-type H+-ATPase subunit E/Vma4
MTEQKLVNKIITEAKREATIMLDAAAETANRKVADAKIAAAKRKADAIESAKKDAGKRKEQAEKANEVELIKARINAKQAVMSAVFDAVKQKIDTKKVVKLLTDKYAKAGDKIITAPDGGIIIRNKNYDIDLSVDTLICELRKIIELQVAEMLF